MTRVDVAGVVRSTGSGDDQTATHVGIEFDDLPVESADRILEYCHVLRPASMAAVRSVAAPTRADLGAA